MLGIKVVSWCVCVCVCVPLKVAVYLFGLVNSEIFVTGIIISS